MNNYNSIEKNISLLLSNCPKTKLLAKKLYQKLNYFFYKKPYNFQTNYKLNKISIRNEEAFFGYYDKSPINKSNKYLIFQSSDHSTKKLPNSNNPIKIILYDFVENKIIKEFLSSSYNWQQGTKLQWIDDERFIYNDYDKTLQKYISKIINSVTGKIVKIINYPIYDVHKTTALSLNFDRLNLVRPDYGYRNRLEKVNLDFTHNEKDGIFFVNLEKNTSKLIISLKDVIKVHYKENMKKAKHWFNHIMISPSGDKFMFLHRWLVGNRKFDALIVSDIYGNNIKCLADDDMVSHCYWNGNSEIVSYMRDKQHGYRYYMIDIETVERKILGKGIIDKFGDGHPNIYQNNILFDTYPNKARIKELYLFNLKNSSLIKLGEFFESLKYYGETRCDLHPKWSYDGKKIFFDSVHTGQRYMYILEFEKFKNIYL